jgi:hypothetical protein
VLAVPTAHFGQSTDPGQPPSPNGDRVDIYSTDISRCNVVDVEVTPNRSAVGFGSVRVGVFRSSYAETRDPLHKHLADALAREITLVGFNSSANDPSVKAIPDGYDTFEVSQAVVLRGRNGQRQPPPYRYANHVDHVECADRVLARRGI